MMKEYEVYSDLRVPVNSKIIIRLDGRSFHSFAQKMELEKPYDDNFYNVMAEVCKELFEEFSPLFITTKKYFLVLSPSCHRKKLH